jgi:ubiquinone/menaquinone biosynthesis C-methylase UbiE
MFGSEERKGGHQPLWAYGDYTVVGTTLQIVSEQLCEAVDLRGGQRVLDVASGTGNTAIAAARRACDVVGIDYALPLLQRACLRAGSTRLT